MRDADDKLWRAIDLPTDRLDELPFGAIVIDANGIVLEYNEYESRLSHQERAAVIGRNFFRDIAPCTAVRAFEGRLHDFLKLREQISESFDYFFPFAHGAVDVTITFLRLHKQGQVLIAVERVATPPKDPSV